MAGMMILGGDFGGTFTKLGLVEDGRVAASSVIPSPSKDGLLPWLPTLKENAKALCKTAGIELEAIGGMVWALPLIIDPGLRRATCSFGKFEDAKREDFCEQVEQIFGLPLRLENDARAAVIGEWQAGAGRGMRDLGMVTLGTGIGTSVISAGRPLRGRSGMAGNLGGLSVTHLGAPAKNLLPPGRTEFYAASWTLLRRASAMADFTKSSLTGESRLDYPAVFRHADNGDSIACQLRDEALEAWGSVVLNLIQAHDLERVILGGGIVVAANGIVSVVQDFVSRHAVQAGGKVDIVAGELGDRAAIIGCEWIWNNEKKQGA